MAQRTNVFVSYSHRDKRWLDRLAVHLRPLERAPHRIVVWSDERIPPGAVWKDEVEKALASTRVAILLVSADFLSSEFVTENELPPLLRAAETEGAVILPVILTASRFLRTESLSRFQAVNDPAKPLAGLEEHDREAVFNHLAERVEDALRRDPPPAKPAERRVPAPSSAPDPVREAGMAPAGQELPESLRRPFARTVLNASYRFEGYVVGRGNEFAHAAARAVAERASESYNPFFVWGSSGLGKTHLLQAIGHDLMEREPVLRVVYLPAEEFVFGLREADRRDLMQEYRGLFRGIDVLLLDDVEVFANQPEAAEELFHTFNSLYTARRQIVLSCNVPPRRIAGLEEKLRSRFEWGLIADLQPPDLETKVAILHRKAGEDGTVLPEEVAVYIASQVRSNVRELEGLLNRVLAYAAFTGKSLALGLAKETLRDLVAHAEDQPARPG